ncbi:MAG: hypothetical protein HW380_2718, partial [Magnetococcales bacterium]|nr:hypothetical protein [Magnetococcales bacterium]
VIKERTQALHQEIKGGLDSGKAETGGGPAAELLATLKEAEPLVAGVVEQYSQALDSLNTAKTLQAVEHQKNALVGLAKTRELFLAIKGLLDLAWQDENRIMAGLKPDQPQGQEQVAVVLEMQETNLTRLRRVGPKIVEELQQARKADAPEDAEKKAEDAKDQKENREADIRRLERANQLQAEVVEKMDLVRQDFAKVGKGDDDLAPVRARVEVVLKSLEELRGLFFSVEEHLRQTAQRQKDLLDETHRLEPLTASQDEKPLQKAVGPLQERQQNLAQTAGAIGDALGEQVAAIKKMPAEDAASPGEKKQEGVKQWEAVITQVRMAKEAMEGAVNGLKVSKPELTGVKGLQGDALKALMDALALLSPPKQETKPQDPKGENGKKTDSGGGDEDEKGKKPEKKDPQETPSDATGSRMLQGIRDREAMRQRQRGERGRMNYEPVEKDW